MLWCSGLATFLALLPFGLPFIVASFEPYPIIVRAAATVLVIAPVGFLQGFGFPTGMRLVNAIDSRPTPWFWAINGAAGVLASVLAVMIGIAFGINVTMLLAAVCYVLLIPAARALALIPAVPTST